MCCSELPRLSRWLLPPPLCSQRKSPAVTELGIVRCTLRFFSVNEDMSDDLSESNKDVGAKVAAIFRELVRERASRLDGSHYNRDSAAAIARALSFCTDDRSSSADCTARGIAFHLTDWASDAAFIVAVQLFPERFTATEIAEGVEAFLYHAPNHVAAAAVLSGQPAEDIFGVTSKDSNVPGSA